MAKEPKPGYYGNRYDDEPDDYMKHPDPKKHQIISFAKSAIRIIASIGGTMAAFSSAELAIAIVAIGYGIAEVVGIYEELV